MVNEILETGGGIKNIINSIQMKKNFLIFNPDTYLGILITIQYIRANE